MLDNTESPGTGTEAAINKLKEMTVQLRWAKQYIDSLPVEPALHDAALNYAVGLGAAAAAVHGLNRKLYLLENQPPAPKATVADIAGEMKSKGITIEMLRDMMIRQMQAKQAKQGGQNGPSRN